MENAMQVLCSTTPMDGVFGPFIPLGRALLGRGHEVIVATGANLKGRIEENGLDFVEAGLPAIDGVVAAMEDPEVQAGPPRDRSRCPAAQFRWGQPSPEPT